MKDVKERFLSRITQDSSGCWIWNGSKTKDGYGYFFMEGKPGYAHRASYKLFCGPIENLWVLHRCDNPSCVNPEHLFLGTAKDNVQDMLSKDRDNYAKGRHHCNAKLTEDDVLEIRNAVEYRGINKDLAEKYNVHVSTISGIRCNATWRQLI